MTGLVALIVFVIVDKINLRKPRLSKDDVMKRITEENTQNPLNSNLTYSIDFLAHLAMSPLCLAQPYEWDTITQEHPDLIRNVSILLFTFII